MIRELREELGIEIAESDLTPLTFASHAYPDFHLLMPVYLCRRWRGSVAAHEGQELLWVRPDALHHLRHAAGRRAAQDRVAAIC